MGRRRGISWRSRAWYWVRIKKVRLSELSAQKTVELDQEVRVDKDLAIMRAYEDAKIIRWFMRAISKRELARASFPTCLQSDFVFHLNFYVSRRITSVDDNAFRYRLLCNNAELSAHRAAWPIQDLHAWLRMSSGY